MWHKNASVFGIAKQKDLDLSLLSDNTFLPAEEAESSGWGEVRDGTLYFRTGNQILLQFMQEKKHIPKSAVDVKVDEWTTEQFNERGFVPGKKATKEKRGQIVDQLLPRALPTRRRTAVWIDLDKQRLVIDSTSWPVIDEVIRALVKAYEGLNIEDAKWPSHKVVTEWLVSQPDDFTTDDEVTLRYPGESGRVVKYTKANLDAVDVQNHVKTHEANVESMAMTFDSRISFIMTPNMMLRRIKALDVITSSEKVADVDAFENDFVLMAGELSRLFDVLGSLK
jgi:recombination associated protein RdgC